MGGFQAHREERDPSLAVDVGTHLDPILRQRLQGALKAAP